MISPLITIVISSTIKIRSPNVIEFLVMSLELDISVLGLIICRY